MKKIIFIGLLFAVAGAMVSCEKALPVYINDECYLKFVYENDEDSVVNFSFAYGEKQIDTVWLPVRIMGFTVDCNRPVHLRQIETGTTDAVAGKHFIALDDAALNKAYYFIPAGAIEQEIPIVLIRDTSLRSQDYVLKIGIESDEDFSLGSIENLTKRIVISDQLVMPLNWGIYCQHYLGDYGRKKHEFMISVTGEKWDDDYVDNVWADYMWNDNGYCLYIKSLLQEELEKHGPIVEDDGTPVSFD